MEVWHLIYDYFLVGMAIFAGIIFIILQFVTVPYGMTFHNRWGMSVRSNLGWMIMEFPVFIAMFLIYLFSLAYEVKPFNYVTFSIFVLFQLHYLQRSFIFPMLMRGSSKMPISLIVTGFIFNTFNAGMQGGWLFFFAPVDRYPISWFWSPQFIIGIILFFLGMTINMHADRIIRNLRKDSQDNNYYIPHGWPFKRISSANYFGELVEWLGFAILSWSFAGVVFLLWSFANIVPRSKEVYERYTQFFGEDFKKLNRYKIFPYIY